MNAPLILICCANTKKLLFVFLKSPIIFVFVFGHFWKAEEYSYSYLVVFGEPNIIRIGIRSFLEARIIFVFGQFWKA